MLRFVMCSSGCVTQEVQALDYSLWEGQLSLIKEELLQLRASPPSFSSSSCSSYSTTNNTYPYASTTALVLRDSSTTNPGSNTTDTSQGGVHEADRRMMLLVADMAGREAVRLGENKILDAIGLCSVQQYLQAFRKEIVDGVPLQDGLAASIALLSGGAAGGTGGRSGGDGLAVTIAQPFRNWELVMGMANMGVLESGMASSKAEMFVDLSMPVRRSLDTLTGVAAAVVQCDAIVTSLLKKSKLSPWQIVRQQILTLVEYVFCELVPLPLCLPHGDAAAKQAQNLSLGASVNSSHQPKKGHYLDEWWSVPSRSSLDAHKREALLGLLLKCMSTYWTCTMGMPEGLKNAVKQQVEVTRLVTIGSIVTLFDYVLRVGDSPLAKAYDDFAVDTCSFAGIGYEALLQNVQMCEPRVAAARARVLQYLHGEQMNSKRRIMGWQARSLMVHQSYLPTDPVLVRLESGEIKEGVIVRVLETHGMKNRYDIKLATLPTPNAEKVHTDATTAGQRSEDVDCLRRVLQSRIVGAGCEILPPKVQPSYGKKGGGGGGGNGGGGGGSGWGGGDSDDGGGGGGGGGYGGGSGWGGGGSGSDDDTDSKATDALAGKKTSSNAYPAFKPTLESRACCPFTTKQKELKGLTVAEFLEQEPDESEEQDEKDEKTDGKKDNKSGGGVGGGGFPGKGGFAAKGGGGGGGGFKMGGFKNQKKKWLEGDLVELTADPRGTDPEVWTRRHRAKVTKEQEDGTYDIELTECEGGTREKVAKELLHKPHPRHNKLQRTQDTQFTISTAQDPLLQLVKQTLDELGKQSPKDRDKLVEKFCPTPENPTPPSKFSYGKPKEPPPPPAYPEELLLATLAVQDMEGGASIPKQRVWREAGCSELSRFIRLMTTFKLALEPKLHDTMEWSAASYVGYSQGSSNGGTGSMGGDSWMKWTITTEKIVAGELEVEPNEKVWDQLKLYNKRLKERKPMQVSLSLIANEARLKLCTDEEVMRQKFNTPLSADVEEHIAEKNGNDKFLVAPRVGDVVHSRPLPIGTDVELMRPKKNNSSSNDKKAEDKIPADDKSPAEGEKPSGEKQEWMSAKIISVDPRDLTYGVQYATDKGHSFGVHPHQLKNAEGEKKELKTADELISKREINSTSWWGVVAAVHRVGDEDAPEVRYDVEWSSFVAKDEASAPGEVTVTRRERSLSAASAPVDAKYRLQGVKATDLVLASSWRAENPVVRHTSASYESGHHLVSEEEVNKGEKGHLVQVDSLTMEDSEKLLSILTVPHLAIPLLLEFFAKGRTQMLGSYKLQSILDTALFEAGAFTVSPDQHTMLHGVDYKPATCFGVLMEEVLHFPNSLFAPLLSMIKAARTLSAGGSFQELVSGLQVQLVYKVF
jgi:hypothetical protein